MRHLRALATDAAGKLDVLGHDGHTLGVDGAEVGVLEETDEVRLGGLLECLFGVGGWMGEWVGDGWWCPGHR